MQDLNLRLGSASELTYSQLDLNFKRIPSGYVSLGLSDVESKKTYLKNGK